MWSNAYTEARGATQFRGGAGMGGDGWEMVVSSIPLLSEGNKVPRLGTVLTAAAQWSYIVEQGKG